MTRILIADSNTAYQELIRTQIRRETDMEVIGIASDGDKALRIAQAEAPDVIVLEAILPRVDGLRVISRLKEQGVRTAFILATMLDKDSVIEEALALGVDYVLLKPYSVVALIERIRAVVRNDANPPEDRDGASALLERTIASILRELGMSTHLKGYQCAKEGLFLVTVNAELVGKVTTHVYPAIGQKVNCSVERALRNAIEVAWRDGNKDAWCKFFGQSMLDRGKRPSNSVFLSTLADQIRLQRAGNH